MFRNVTLTQHPDWKLAGRLQVLDHALRHHPNVILPRDFVIVGSAQYPDRLLPGRIQEHNPRLAVHQFHEIAGIRDQDRVQYRELERVLHLGYSLADRLHEIVVARYLRGDHAELMPLVPLEDAQHRGRLMLQRWRQL